MANIHINICMKFGDMILAKHYYYQVIICNIILYIHTSQASWVKMNLYNMRLDCFTDICDQSIHYYFTFAYIQFCIKQAWTLSIVHNILLKFVSLMLIRQINNTSLNIIWGHMTLKGFYWPNSASEIRRLIMSIWL